MYFEKVLLVLVTIACSSGIWSVDSLKRRRTTTSWVESSSLGAVMAGNEDDTRSYNYSKWPPVHTTAAVPPQHPPHSPTHHPTVRPPHTHEITIVDQYDHRYPDGSYEFRYQLTDDTVRYERGYFVSYQYKNILVVKGYYSYRLPDLRYLTVFYTADQNGYRQDSSDFSTIRPQLPRSLNVQGDSTAAEDSHSGEEKSIFEEE